MPNESSAIVQQALLADDLSANLRKNYVSDLVCPKSCYRKDSLLPTNIKNRTAEILTALAKDTALAPYVFPGQDVPAVHRGTGPILLIILGQDPTVKDAESRKGITRVLNLKGSGPLHNYLKRISLDLGLDLDGNIYATNYVKNFFISPPTQIRQMDVLEDASKYWLPLLHEELAEFPNVPVIALGQPLLEHIVTEGASPLVRNYWDYAPHWKLTADRDWRHLAPNQNKLNRIVFPFPHQPSLRNPFYRQHLRYYLQYVKQQIQPTRQENKP